MINQKHDSLENSSSAPSIEHKYMYVPDYWKIALKYIFIVSTKKRYIRSSCLVMPYCIIYLSHNYCLIDNFLCNQHYAFSWNNVELYSLKNINMIRLDVHQIFSMIVKSHVTIYHHTKSLSAERALTNQSRPVTAERILIICIYLNTIS